MSSTTATTGEESESKTYWCYECDMSVEIISSSPRLLCPNCNTHFLELMDSPPFPHFDTNPYHSFPSLSLFDDPYFHNLIRPGLVTAADYLYDDDYDDDEQEDGYTLFSPTISSWTSKSYLDSIPTIKVTSFILNELDPGGLLCAICKDPITVDSEAKQLPCKHLYHSDCIIPWLEGHNSCPLCRFKLGAEEAEEEASRTGGIRRQLRTAMMRLAEIMEEEGDLFGLRTTLSHIAWRHRFLSSSTSRQSDSDSSLSVSPIQMEEAETRSGEQVDSLDTVLSLSVEGPMRDLDVGIGDGEEELVLRDRFNEYVENSGFACKVSSSSPPSANSPRYNE